MDKKILAKNIGDVFNDFKTAIRQHTELNQKRADGGWSVGEIADHMIKGTRINFNTIEKTERPFDQHAISIRETFLNPDLKFEAAPILLPDQKEYIIQDLLLSLDQNKDRIVKMIDTEDLTETVADMVLPGWGALTKYEWLVLFESHMIRHTRQVNTFTRGVPANAGKYWNDLYDSNDIGWDIGFPSPAIRAYIDQLQEKDIAILIPGCGNAYEAEYLLSLGFTNITLIDIAPTLTAELEKKFTNELNKRIHIITGDFFKHAGRYRLILEQTFLSALHPSLRTRYTDKMHSLLTPGGKLVGVLFNKHFDDSPPYGGSIEEYRQLFTPNFRIEILEPCYNSIDRRKDSEVFIQLIAH